MVRRISKLLSPLWLVLLSLGVGGCQRPGHPDRFECINRPVYAFNKAADRVVLRPVARVYEALIPKPLQTGVSHFFQNLASIPSAANNLLQANGSAACTELARFLINSTWGVGGLFDLAGTRGLVASKQDFGLTLAKWGYRDSSYLVLPFLGPSTVRDGVGRLGTYAMSVPTYLHSVRVRNTLLGLNYVSLRASLLKLDSSLEQAVDEYIFVREAYLQHRQSEMAGKGPRVSTPSSLDGPPE